MADGYTLLEVPAPCRHCGQPSLRARYVQVVAVGAGEQQELPTLVPEHPACGTHAWDEFEDASRALSEYLTYELAAAVRSRDA